jgi:Rrf2 family protein
MNSDFVVAVHSLVLLAYTPERLRTSDNIANSVSIHPVRIRKVLSTLRKGGYIQSKEGAKGGFYLTRDPASITLAELYTLTSEGTLKPKWPDANPSCPIGAHIERAMDDIFATGEKQLEAHFQHYTIADVLQRVHNKSL